AFQLPAAFALALIVTVLAVPVAISVARRWGLLDHPQGWKCHAQPTPYLGGAALLCGFSIAAVLFAEGDSLRWLLVCCAGLCVLGTLDDRWGLPAGVRIAATVSVAVVTWSVHLGWSVFSSDAQPCPDCCVGARCRERDQSARSSRRRRNQHRRR